jgi:hypothetical protein
MDYNSLRPVSKQSDDLVLFIGESVGIRTEGQWFLNEERVFIGDSDDAVSILQEKQEISNNKKVSLVEETYSVETTIKLIKIHNKKVTQNVLESCIDAASSKSLTNDSVVLELRKTGKTIDDKYVFVLENGEVAAIDRETLDSLRSWTNESIEYARQGSEQLKEVIEASYNG